MYIISKTKDYYDGAVGMGIDKKIVYERKEDINDNPYNFVEPFTRESGWNRRKRSSFHKISFPPEPKEYSKYADSSAFIVGFCGKLYIGWKFYREISNIYSKLKTFITYDLDFVKNELGESTWGGNLNDDINYILNYDPMEIFRKLNSPIFIYDTDYDRKYLNQYTHKKVFITNPTLKDYKFYKVMHSYTAFQEIQMFLGGVLGTGEKEIDEIDDKYKITQHGFNKYSFRRSKSNGKKRPQSNR